MSTSVTLIGRVGTEPELKFTNSNKAVASFSMVTSRNYKDDAGDWQETETTWWRVTVWDKQGENVTESVRKGDNVIVQGRAFMDTYTDKDGFERQSLKVQAYNVALDLKRATASAKRIERSAGNTGVTPVDDWMTPGQNDIPPF